MGRVSVRRALVSVSDKTGIDTLARALVAAGVEIVSSGGTAAALREAGVPVREVTELTGVPEMLDGRVKTLHPAIHAGILADRSKPEHLAALAAHGIQPIDLVVVSLYPFEREPAVELIDVGGPAMVRAAAKNFASVGVVVDPEDYEVVAAEVAGGGLEDATRRRLAAKAFARLSAYDAAVASWLAGDDPVPQTLALSLQRHTLLRYGENPHQQGGVYLLPGPPRGVAAGEQLQGIGLSYTNYLDLDAAFGLATAFQEPAACIIKHTSPCGAAVAQTIEEAYRLAYECDTRAAFGGIVGLNRPCTAGVAEVMSEVKLDCVLAPDFAPEALEILGRRKGTRLIRLPPERWGRNPLELRTIAGAVLAQTPDPVAEGRGDMRVVTARQPTPEEWRDLLFAWVVCAHVRSNTIVLARDRQAVGVGAGQMSRVESFELAIRRAGERAKGAVAASDALIPFEDNVEVAAAAGVTAIIQTGGSVRDAHVIRAADAAGIAMVFTGYRHFRH